MNQSVLNRLQHQHQALDHLLMGLPEEKLRQRPDNGKWSIFENIAHLGRYQQVFLERMELVIKGDNPQFSRYVADEDPKFISWTNKPWTELQFEFQTGRQKLIQFLSSLDDQQLSATGRHPVFGIMNVTGWSEFFLLHEAHHFFTILKLAASWRPANQPMG